jgi:hypothetical protein
VYGERLTVCAAVWLGATSLWGVPGQSTPYEIIGRFTVTDQWDGSPLVLAVNQNAVMPQTPAGSMVLSYLNVSAQNNLGELSVTSGGGAPQFLYAPALSTEPGVVVNNWQTNNLSITNISANLSTPIRIQAIGPGIPGSTPVALPTGSPGIALAPGRSASGPTQPRYMQLVVQASSGARSVFAVIGGPADQTGNNAYVIAVNASATTGPPGTAPAPPGYYATTRDNSYVLTFNWSGSSIFVANLSSSVTAPLSVLLRAL